MKRVKFLIISGTLIFATATSFAVSSKEKSEAPISKSEALIINADEKRKKVRCWNKITSRSAKPEKKVLFCTPCGGAIELTGRRTLFSRSRQITVDTKDASR